MITTAVLIAGGEGTRLRPLTDDRPKPLVEIAGKPILQWIIEWLKSYGIKKLVIGVSYKKEKIYEFMEKNNNFGLEVCFSEHSLDGGTAQGFGLAIQRHIKGEENFIAMNGDELTNLDLGEMMRTHREKLPHVTMALAPFSCPFSVVETDPKEGTIVGFKYGKTLRQVPISIGIYIFNKGILSLIPERGSIENEVFRSLAQEKKMVPYHLMSGEEWVSVNALKDIEEAEKKLDEWGRL
ncbi:MAG TPA: nucleotidyltransferase family protein [Candidatus Nanoarchaeia archaeon]|nr:nucleotidyltransferase family protein [Candidatus Nanoarchaeia archaeon]